MNTKLEIKASKLKGEVIDADKASLIYREY
jgi:hypothetical protein